LVAELARFRDRLSPKFHYLADAPTKDPDGQPTIVRFSRKTKQQYVMSESKDGKASGWSAWYDGKKWKAEDKRKKGA
jgi:DNA topoisomerase I